MYIAAAYLNWAKDQLNQQFAGADETGPVKPALPDTIGGHPWFLFVDQAIDYAQVEDLTRALNDDYKFLEALLSDEQDSTDKQQPEAQQEQVYEETPIAVDQAAVLREQEVNKQHLEIEVTNKEAAS